MSWEFNGTDVEQTFDCGAEVHKSYYSNDWNEYKDYTELKCPETCPKGRCKRCELIVTVVRNKPLHERYAYSLREVE